MAVDDLSWADPRSERRGREFEAGPSQLEEGSSYDHSPEVAPRHGDPLTLPCPGEEASGLAPRRNSPRWRSASSILVRHRNNAAPRINNALCRGDFVYLHIHIMYTLFINNVFNGTGYLKPYIEWIYENATFASGSICILYIMLKDGSYMGPFASALENERNGRFRYRPVSSR